MGQMGSILNYLSSAYEYGVNHPEAVVFGGIMLLLLFRRKLKSALILAFGVALCFANYFVFTEYGIMTIPLAYAATFAGISIVLVLLLVYQFIQTT